MKRSSGPQDIFHELAEDVAFRYIAKHWNSYSNRTALLNPQQEQVISLDFGTSSTTKKTARSSRGIVYTLQSSSMLYFRVMLKELFGGLDRNGADHIILIPVGDAASRILDVERIQPKLGQQPMTFEDVGGIELDMFIRGNLVIQALLDANFEIRHYYTNMLFTTRHCQKISEIVQEGEKGNENNHKKVATEQQQSGQSLNMPTPNK